MGFFSWMTQDTNKSIANHYSGEPVFTVYLMDDKGNTWQEDNYEGYGEFGGKDYYELLDEMNGGNGDRDAGCELGLGIPTIRNVHTGEILDKTWFNWANEIVRDNMSANELIETGDWEQYTVKPLEVRYPNLVENPDWVWRNDEPEACEFQGFFYEAESDDDYCDECGEMHDDTEGCSWQRCLHCDTELGEKRPGCQSHYEICAVCCDCCCNVCGSYLQSTPGANQYNWCMCAESTSSDGKNAEGESMSDAEMRTFEAKMTLSEYRDIGWDYGIDDNAIEWIKIHGDGKTRYGRIKGKKVPWNQGYYAGLMISSGGTGSADEEGGIQLVAELPDLGWVRIPAKVWVTKPMVTSYNKSGRTITYLSFNGKTKVTVKVASKSKFDQIIKTLQKHNARFSNKPKTKAKSSGSKTSKRKGMARRKAKPKSRSSDVKKRKGPNTSATSFNLGTRKRGNDGKMWTVKRSGKSKRWVRGAEEAGDGRTVVQWEDAQGLSSPSGQPSNIKWAETEWVDDDVDLTLAHPIKDGAYVAIGLGIGTLVLAAGLTAVEVLLTRLRN